MRGASEEPPAAAARGEAQHYMENSRGCLLQRRRDVQRGGRKFTEITHVFGESCLAGVVRGDEFGVREYIGFFAEDGLRGFEGNIDDMVDHDERWLANTLDVSLLGAT